MGHTFIGALPICGLVALGLNSPVAFGETKTLRATADTTLHEFSPDANMGGHTHVAAGSTALNATGAETRGLLKFDLTGQIPADATIESAVLTLQVTFAPFGGPNSVFELHRILQPWGEGTKTGNLGAPATAGEATWKNRLSPNTPWSAPGASAPGDFAGTLSALSPVSGVGSYNFGSSANLVADVQLWLKNPDSNFGWILISQSESVDKTARRFGSREDSANAPTLTITFTAPVTTTAPSITTQPQSQTVSAGAAANFNVAASGTAPLSYQWKYNGSDIPGAISAILSLANVQPNQAGAYSVAVSNAAGSVTSATATLTVNVPVAITQSPQSQIVSVGATATFSVTASGTAPLSYQWKFNANDISGAINPTLMLTNVQSSDAGAYRVSVSNAAGSLLSAEAILTVNAVADVPPRFDRVEHDRDTLRILFTVEPTFAIALESIDSLSLTNWMTRTNFTAKTDAIKAIVTDASSASPQRFYRLRVTGRVR